MVKKGYGLRNGSKRGSKVGGRGRNRTDDCRHPTKKK